MSQQPFTTQVADEDGDSGESEAETDHNEGSNRGKPLAEACPLELNRLGPGPALLAMYPWAKYLPSSCFMVHVFKTSDSLSLARLL